MNGLAASREASSAEIERAARGEFGEKRGAFRARQEHGVTEMFADARARKHMREKQALVDLGTVLVALPMGGFGVDLVSCRDQPGDELRRGVDEVVAATERRAVFGQAIVDL